MTDKVVRLVASAIVGLGVPVTAAAEPYILPTELQEFAIKINLVEGLDIDWTEASAEDIATYMHTLAAIDIVAQRIAEANHGKEPRLEDYEAAAAAWCKIDLPNKPPSVAKFSTSLEGAYVSMDKQASIAEAVGPVLLEGSLEGLESFLINEAPVIDEYQEKVLDFSILVDQV